MLHSCLTPLQGLFNSLVSKSPKVRSAKQLRRGEENLSWRQASIKAYMSRGDRRRTGRNLSSRNTRTCTSRVSTWKQWVHRFWTHSNDQSSTNPKQVSDPPASDKLVPLSNPHLADDMKEAEGNNTMPRPQQEEFLATDGDDEEKCEEQKTSSRLELDRRRWCIPSHQTWRRLNNTSEFIFK